MFRLATPQNTKRAVEKNGKISPLAIPYKGMNARAPFSVMGPEHAISLRNVICEAYGLRTRKGYTEYANGLPSANPVATLLVYYPSDAPVVGASSLKKVIISPVAQFFASHPDTTTIPASIHLFAAQGGQLFDVTAGGTGPWTPEVGVAMTTDYWTWLNTQNVAGSFLVATNNGGGYAIYNGTSWTIPTMGGGAGQIANVDPDDFVFVMEFKQRLWFIEKESTSAWFLPVDQITGSASEFDFGTQFPHGGHLVAIANWTVDSGDGIDDRLVAVGSQGDVVIYQGTDPTSSSTFSKVGTWYVGPLPAGRRSVTAFGGDVHILSQFGLVPVSKLQATANLAADSQQHISYMIDPLLARLMQQYGSMEPWQILDASREELILIGVPTAIFDFGGAFFAYKVTSQSWSILSDTGYAYTTPIGGLLMAGTTDGRVVKAFNGPLDNVLLSTSLGEPIFCQVTPSYQPMGDPGITKVFNMIRPTFLAREIPALQFSILTDYSLPVFAFTPGLPTVSDALWDSSLWDVGIWSGLQHTVKKWLGAVGTGFSATAQLDYMCGGDTLLMSLDFWSESGDIL